MTTNQLHQSCDDLPFLCKLSKRTCYSAGLFFTSPKKKNSGKKEEWMIAHVNFKDG
jgi:hypothetical protein